MVARRMARVSGEPARVYRHFREVFGDKRPRSKRAINSEDAPFSPGRDVLSVAGAMDSLSSEMGWTTSMAQASLVIDWPMIVGESIAEHTEVQSVDQGVLTVTCDSSAWATQLRLMRHELLVRLSEQVPEAAIESIEVRAPGAPSWRKGPRSVPGRGPRDTYA